VFKFFKLLCFCMGCYLCNDIYSITLQNTQHTFANMSCNDLMLGLIKESSFKKKFQDKNLALEFYFERTNVKYIILKFVKKAGDDNGGIYANFKLNLVNKTLHIIDPYPPIKIKINKDYVPFIADKCTPEKNVYGNTGRLPDKEFDRNE